MATEKGLGSIPHYNTQTRTVEFIPTDNFERCENGRDSTGFSFTVKSEIDAYKASYEYQRAQSTLRVEVRYAANADAWRISVYTAKSNWKNTLRN